MIRFEKDTELENLPESRRRGYGAESGRDLPACTARENGKVGKELERQILEEPDLEKLMSQIMINLPLFYEDKQKLLEAVTACPTAMSCSVS